MISAASSLQRHMHQLWTDRLWDAHFVGTLTTASDAGAAPLQAS